MKKYFTKNPWSGHSGETILKPFFFAICILLATTFSYSQNVNIPDANFKAYLVGNSAINTNEDGEISFAEAEAFTGRISAPSQAIADLTGIEAFINLTELEAYNNNIGSVNLSENDSLSFLNLSLNPIGNLDVSNMAGLELLSCYNCELTELDVTQNPELYQISTHSNSLTSVDVSQNPLLRILHLGNNDLITLNVSANTELVELSASRNFDLEEMDVSGLPELAELYVNNTSLTELDLSDSPKLRLLWAYNTLVSSLNLKNGSNATMLGSGFKVYNTELTCILVSDIDYADANWTNVDEGVTFSDTYCDLNDPVYIPDENFKTLLLGIGSLNANDDDEISYGEAENYSLSITVNDASITDLTGLEAFTNIVGFSAKDNSISEIDLSQNTELGTLVLDNNELTALDVSNNVKLTHLQVFNNQLTSIDVSMLPELRKLWVRQNELTSLNTSSNPLLSDIECGDNQIASLDLSNNTVLTTIQMSLNNLTSLDVSNNPQLFRITAAQNDIEVINLSNNELLTSVNFEFNKLTSIDVSMLPILTSFKVRGNGESLISVNVQNGNNENFTGSVLLDQNPNLTCVQVDDPAYSVANWTFVDEQTSFSTDCERVYIPDETFETYLLGVASINTLDDGRITYAEAEAFTGTINVQNMNIDDLTGIEAFLNITGLIAWSNNISEVDLSNNTELRTLELNHNPLEAVDLTANTKLTKLILSSTDLTSIDVTNNTQLEDFRLSDIELGSVDVTHLANLKYLYVNNTGISSIDVTQNAQLLSLVIWTNPITSVDLSGNPELLTLWAHGSSLESVDFSNNPKLSNIDLRSTPITTLDISGNPDIFRIYVENTALTELDLSTHTALIDVNVNNCTSLSYLNVANGNNIEIDQSSTKKFKAVNVPSLNCVTVDDVVYSDTTWTEVDEQILFSTNCSNDTTEIKSFVFAEQSQVAQIDDVASTITIEVEAGTDVTSLLPSIGLSAGASVSPEGEQDFTDPVVYTVTAEDRVSERDWIVTVTLEVLSMENDILTFSLAEQTGDATIDAENHTVAIEVAAGTDPVSLQPTITVSADASLDQQGAQDFTDPVVYTVTAEDGTEQAWTVTVTVAEDAEPVLSTKPTLDHLSIYPQPASDRLHVIVKTESLVRAEVYDLSGVLVSAAVLTPVNERIQLDIDALPQGVWLLQLVIEDETSTTRFIKY